MQEICCSTSSPSFELSCSMFWASWKPDVNTHFLLKPSNPGFPHLECEPQPKSPSLLTGHNQSPQWGMWQWPQWLCHLLKSVSQLFQNSYLHKCRAKTHIVLVVWLLSRVQLFSAPWTAAHHTSLSFTISWSLLNSCPLSQWCHSTLSSSVVPFSSRLHLSQHQGLFQGVSSSHQVAKVLVLWPQHQSLQWIFRIYFLFDWLVWSPCSPRDSQESSLTPQFKSVNSLVLSLLYGPTLIFKHDYWKNQALTRWTFVSKVMSLFF